MYHYDRPKNTLRCLAKYSMNCKANYKLSGNDLVLLKEHLPECQEAWSKKTMLKLKRKEVMALEWKVLEQQQPQSNRPKSANSPVASGSAQEVPVNKRRRVREQVASVSNINDCQVSKTK